MKTEDLQFLYPTAEVSALRRKEQKKSRVRRLVAAGLWLLAVGLSVWRSQHPQLQESIARTAPGDGQQNYRLEFQWKGEHYRATFENHERQLTETELNEAADRLIAALPRLMLGEQQTAEAIISDLVLPEKVDGYPFLLSYHFSEQSPVAVGGRILRTAQAQPFSLLVRLSYGDWQRDWVWEAVVAGLPGQAAGIEERVGRLLQQAEQSDRYVSQIGLPQQLDDSPLRWPKRAVSPLFIGFWGALLWLTMELTGRERVKKRCRQQQEELDRAYPKLVERLLLYTKAGYKGWQVFERLVQAGKADGLSAVLRLRLQRMLGQIHRGIPVAEAYESFGLSCRSGRYRQLMRLLSDDLHKGQADLEQQLEAEIRRSNRERLERAASAGEKLGTKLIFPTVGLLVICMALIMVPFLTQL
ncbi:MAG: hypothetical protein SPL15_07445 [Lachnospiraceae bacterium]|nr:hypothetical protein [Lachnospiraceae bacterium]MDY5742808.1 hypothetical protein [Lachnospiraceae bacterium]